jgi:hypothetical protein
VLEPLVDVSVDAPVPLPVPMVLLPLVLGDVVVLLPVVPVVPVVPDEPVVPVVLEVPGPVVLLVPLPLVDEPASVALEPDGVPVPIVLLVPLPLVVPLDVAPLVLGVAAVPALEGAVVLVLPPALPPAPVPVDDVPLLDVPAAPVPVPCAKATPTTAASDTAAAIAVFLKLVMSITPVPMNEGSLLARYRVAPVECRRAKVSASKGGNTHAQIRRAITHSPPVATSAGHSRRQKCASCDPETTP